MPKTLKIGAHTYDLVFAEHWEGKDDLDLAETSHKTQTIYILKGLSHTQTFSAILHETMHVMNVTLNHELLDSLAEQISQVLLDNNLR